MSVALPDHIDPWRAVKNGLSMSGALNSAELPRLSAVVVTNAQGQPGMVDYGLSFERDAEGRPCVRGRIRAELRLNCQRCLGEFSLPVDVSIGLALLASERGADELRLDLDPWVVEDDLISPRELIEEELLLAVPVVPRHAPGECQSPDVGGDALRPQTPEGLKQERINPFAVLAGLKAAEHDD